MLNLILLCLLIISLGGLVFLVARKLPLLASLPAEVVLDNGQASPQAVLAKEKIKLLARKFLIIVAHKIISFLRWLEAITKKASEKAKQFYHRQRRQENIQEDTVKKQEEIAKNADYWHTIRHTLVSRAKKAKTKKGSGVSEE